MDSLPAWWIFFGHPDFRKQTFFLLGLITMYSEDCRHGCPKSTGLFFPDFSGAHQGGVLDPDFP
jgi:hypothetical protein